MIANNILVIGGGVAGLSVASELAELDIDAEIVEQSEFPGGHAIQYACKATDQCVKCGACMVEDKLERVVHHLKIKVISGARVESVSKSDDFSVTILIKPVFIDPEKCTNCGIYFEKCPENGAVTKGFSKHHSPFYVISGEKCRYLEDQSCTICRQVSLSRKTSLGLFLLITLSGDPMNILSLFYLLYSIIFQFMFWL